MATDLDRIIKQLIESEIVPPKRLEDFIPPKAQPGSVENLVRELLKEKLLTKFQAIQINAGKVQILMLGGYTILDKIGAGGMGQVYKAQHRRMKRVVALKTLPAKTMKAPEQVARFQREVEAAAKLRHTNIVAADDADEFNGVHFLVMEYVEGKDLSAIVKQDGPLSVDRTLDYVIQAAYGLEYAHKKGIIHRDIKPANLLLGSDDIVKVLDMGLARVQGDSTFTTQAELTNSGVMMGTVDYIAPEQAHDSKQADGRADIYSLGCTLAYLLTGQPTYGGESMIAKLLAHCEAPIPSLCDSRPDVPAELDKVFQKMIAKKPENRFQTMSEVIDSLEELRPNLSMSGTRSMSKGPRLRTSAAFEKTITTSVGETSILASVTEFVNSSKTGRRKWMIAGVFAVVLVAGGLLLKISTTRSPSKSESPSVADNSSNSTNPATTESSTVSKKSELDLLRPGSGLSQVKPSSIAGQTVLSGPELVKLFTSPDLEWSPPEPLGTVVNSSDNESFPRLTTGGLRLWFLRGGILMATQRKSRNDPWEAAAAYTPAIAMPQEVGGRSDESGVRGDLFVSRDERRLAFVTWNNKDAMPIWETTREKTTDPWQPVRLSIRHEGNCQFPVFSDDGLRMFYSSFGSKQNPSKGSQDIFYVSRPAPDRPWSAPIGLNTPLNGALVDRPTWLSSDERVMLLAVGESPQNIYVYRNCWSFREGDEKHRGWSKPVPFEVAPVDKVAEAGAVLSDDGRELYFESSRPGGHGSNDIWFSRLIKKSPDSRPQTISAAPPIGYALERNVARWLHEHRVIIDLSTGTVRADDPLPETDFQVLSFGTPLTPKIPREELFNKLRDVRKLQAFKGGYLPLHDADLWAEAFADIPTVKVINALNTDLTDVGMKHLARLKRIDYLNLDNSSELAMKVTGRGLAELVKCESIGTLSIHSREFREGRFTVADVQKIQNAHPQTNIIFPGIQGKIPGLKPAPPPDRWPFDPPDDNEYVWSTPKNLGPMVNTGNIDIVTGLSADERTIFVWSGATGHFVCDRKNNQELFRTRRPITSVTISTWQTTFSGNGLAFAGAPDSGAELIFADRRARNEDFTIKSKIIPETGMLPILSEDGLTLLVISTRTGSISGDIWMYERSSLNEPFRPAVRIQEPVNTPHWDMPTYISNDRCFMIAMEQFDDDQKKVVRYPRWFTRRNENADFSEGHSFDIPLIQDSTSTANGNYNLSGDGLAVYFSTNELPGGMGDLDVYVSRRVPKK